MSVASHEDLSMDRDLLATVLDIAGALVVVLDTGGHILHFKSNGRANWGCMPELVK